MDLISMWNKITEFFENIISLIGTFVDLLKDFVNMIPQPFRAILLIFISLMTIVTIWRATR